MEGKPVRGSRPRFSLLLVKNISDALEIDYTDIIDWGSSPNTALAVAFRDGLAGKSHAAAAVQLRADFTAARSQQAPANKRRALAAVAAGAKQLIKAKPEETGIVRLCAKCQAALADIEQMHFDKYTHRKSAIEILYRSYDKNHDPLDLVMLANHLSDLAYEFSPSEVRGWMLSYVSQVLNALRAEEATFRSSPHADTATRVLLLTQASSLHRAHAYLSLDREKSARYATMRRCAELALSVDKSSPHVLVEAAQAKWYSALWVAKARLAASPADAHDEIVRAFDADLAAVEELLQIAAGSGYVVPRLVLARFYRQTYRPALAVHAFKTYAASEYDVARLRKEVYLVGEAAWQLAWRGDPGAMDALKYAEPLLQDALSAGFQSARHLLVCAIVRALLDGPEAGKSTLCQLHSDGSVTFSDLLELAIGYIETGDVEKLRVAFTFGMDQASNWNSLGTFVHRFLANPHLALRIYDTGLKLAPHSQTLLLNRARIHKELGNEAGFRASLRAAHAHSSATFLPFVLELEKKPSDVPHNLHQFPA